MRAVVPLLLLTCACSKPSDRTAAAPADLPASAAVQARYVVLGASSSGDTVAIARAIVAESAACPRIRAADTSAMSARDNPHGFPVKVCEALVPFDSQLTLLTADAQLSLPRIKSQVSRILVMGDTGCKSKDCPPGTPAQPFAALAAGAAPDPADVILHMGDYNYRGTGSHIEVTIDGETTEQWSYDAGDGVAEADNCLQAPTSGFLSQNAANAKPHDSWPAWRDDFFTPAGALLYSAPWVLARGNHELCSRAGPGWFYFLDPSSNLHGAGQQKSCPQPQATGNPITSVVLNQPYRISLGSFNIVVVDSANACDAFVTPPMRDFTSAYTEQFKQISALTPQTGTTWMMSHRPLWGVQGYEPEKSSGCTADNKLSCINRVLQNALTEGLSGALPDPIQLSVAGHMHHFQSLTFTDTDRPPQLIVGNGGVALAADGPTGSFPATVQGRAAQVLDMGVAATTPQGPISGHGFLDVRLRADGQWSGRLVDTAKQADLALCGSKRAKQGGVCAFAPGVKVPQTPVPAPSATPAPPGKKDPFATIQ